MAINKNTIDEQLNSILLSDEEIKTYLLMYMLFNVKYKESDNNDFFYNDYDVYLTLIKDNTNGLKDYLEKLLNKYICNDIINDAVVFYNDLMITEAKQVIYSISRLLYVQEKYKNNEVGAIVDTIIKEWLEYIKTTDYDILKEELSSPKDLNNEVVRRYNAYKFNEYLPIINNMIYSNTEEKTPFLKQFKDNSSKEQIKNNFKELITNNLRNAKGFNRYSDIIINPFINTTLNTIQLDIFQDIYSKEIQELKDKVDNNEIQGNNKLDIQNTILLNEVNLEPQTQTSIINDYLKDDDYLKGVYALYQDFKETKDFNDLELENKDVIKWRKQAKKFMDHLTTLTKKPKKNTLGINYTIDYLAYNEYQQDNYKLVKKKKPSKEELKEKYKDITQLKENEQLDYKRKWARVDTSKVNTNVMDLRESVVKKVENKTDITRKKINKIENKTKPSKDDIKQLKELKDLLATQEKEKEKLTEEYKELEADIDLINKAIADTTDAKQINSLTRKRKKMEKQLREQQDILNDKGIYLQAELFDDKLLVAEKVNKKTKESYKLMINSDYDIQNFNSEGRNFLYYIPNIPNVINELDGDYITVDMDLFMDFTGRPTGNVSRVRTNLQNTLKEMRKETYDYTYLDDKGKLHDDSLVLIADIKGTEYKGKATIQVQLGATFKENLKEAFTKSQYVKVNSDVFKIGQGRNNKAENMAKEIFLYLAKLCRNEAKKQVNSGKWRKDVHLETIINKLCELNLIKYNPNRYNESVKEPLLYALNMGVELGYFEYETNAFSYYDDVIASKNRGANNQDKITNFEKGDKYGIKFIINGDMVDLEKNKKAYDTYEKNKKKYKKKNN